MLVTISEFRITVRGAFDGLASDQRAELLADAGAHDIFHSEFTAEGHPRTAQNVPTTGGAPDRPGPFPRCLGLSPVPRDACRP